MSELNVTDLRKALNQVLDEVEKRSGLAVELTADHYWTIDARAAFALDVEPRPTMGQLSDDLDDLAGQLSGRRRPVVWHDLEHLIGLLRHLAAADVPR